MIKVLFVCHGNICRSPMAEFMFKKLVADQKLDHSFYIASAAVSNEEYGNPVYPPARKKLLEHDINPSGKTAIQLTKSDYEKYDFILAMERYNLGGLKKILGVDSQNKIHLLLDYTDNPGDIADPWYTGDFNITYEDILRGLNGFLEYLKTEYKEEIK